MDGSVPEEDRILRCSGCLFLLNRIRALAKTAPKKIGALIRSMKFRPPVVTLYLYKSTAWSCVEYSCNFFFFSIWVFFHEHSRFTEQQGKGEGIYLTPLYHFHPLHRHLDISRPTAAESSPLQPDSNREPLVSERKSLTTKLRALYVWAGARSCYLVMLDKLQKHV